MISKWGTAAMVASAITAAVVVGASSPPAVDAGVTTTVAPTPTVAAPTTTVGGASTTAVAAPLPSLPPPADEASDPVGLLVPSIVAVEEQLDTVAERQPVVAAALTEATNSVAVVPPVRTLCAVVPVAAPLMSGGRWERDGEPLESAELTRRDPPGYGDCISTDETGGFDEGVYQYVAVGDTGALSAAVTLVIGVPSVAVWLLNNGDSAVCLVQASPPEADFYEAFQADSELLPGEALAIRVAAVEQQLRVFGCSGDDVTRSFEFEPEQGVYVDLFADEEPDESAPGGSVTSTTSRPTTTG